MSRMCHRLVAKTAKAIAAEVYEVCASTDRFYKQYPTLQGFVDRQWSSFIGDARKSLTAMLREAADSTPEHPTYLYSQHVRDEIFEALLAEGEMKGPAPLDLNQLREAAGFDPLPKPLPGLH